MLVTPTTKNSSADDYEDTQESEEGVRSMLARLIDDAKALQTANQARPSNLEVSECALWISEHFIHFHYGLILDPLLMSDGIYGDER